LILSCGIFPTPLVLALNVLMDDLVAVVVMEVIEVIEGALMIAEIILTEDTNNILATISDSKNLTDNCQF
jgi:hypothetical protein